MTVDTENASKLLRDLAVSLVEVPPDIVVVSQEALTGERYFAMKCNVQDEAVLVGTEGCHVNAFTHLVSRFGEAVGRRWTFRLITGSVKYMRRPRVPYDVPTYDPEPAKAQLERILQALEIGGFSVAVGPGVGVRRSLTFVFDIRLKDKSDSEELLKTRRLVIREASPRGPEKAIEMSDIDAIGTLFRAMAKRDGVRFQINVVKP